VVAAVLLAVVAAMLFGAASVLQQRAAVAVPASMATGLKLIGRLLRRRLWLAGVALDGLGLAAQAAALGYGAVLVVEPVLATALLFALLADAVWARASPPGAQWAWTLALSAGLACFLVVGDPSAGLDHASTGRWLVAGAVYVPILVLLVALAARAPGRRRALMLGIGAGMLFGAMAAVAKPAVGELTEGAWALVSSWEPYAVAVCGLAGGVLQQAAYQAGALRFSLPATTVVEPLAAAALGIGVLDEAVSARGAGWLLIAASCAAMIAGTVILARPARERSTGTGVADRERS
jgi:hypothetical protein